LLQPVGGFGTLALDEFQPEIIGARRREPAYRSRSSQRLVMHTATDIEERAGQGCGRRCAPAGKRRTAALDRLDTVTACHGGIGDSAVQAETPVCEGAESASW